MNIKSIGNKIKGNPKMIEGTVYSMLIICSISHFLNDMIQSIIPSIYPIVKDKFGFSFAQIGIITLVFQMTSSILQPFTGLYADKHPRPYALSIGMCFTLVGLLLLAFAENYFLILLAVSVVGLGSSVFHPTASRVAQMASGGKKSLAQSIFQVGGNGGSAIGPLLAAIIILPFGQHAISWFALAALLAAIIMVRLGVWYKARLTYVVNHPQKQPLLNTHISKRMKYWALFILIMLVFSKYFYTACITSYFTFFLIDKFGVSVQTSQLCLFVFLAAFAIGTVAGGMLGDKFGRKYVIWFSILGAAPFAIAMPFVNFTWTIICTFMSGLIIASAFSSIVVYATDLMPDKVGLIAGIFFGLMFGLGGLGSAFFGWLADKTSVEFIFQVSAFLPLLGIIAGFLPNTQKRSVEETDDLFSEEKEDYLKDSVSSENKESVTSPDKEYDLTDLFERLSKSAFRSRFHLSKRDKEYIAEKGLATIRKHAEDFVAKRLAPAVIPNDGKQTPMRGHPVFIAQHATGCCCRGCFFKWHHIPAGRQMTREEQQYAVAVLMAWIEKQV